MMWIISNIGTILVSLALLVAIVLIIKSMVKKKKSGVVFCGGNCVSCNSRGCCH